jgi:hypothetical protein
MVISGLSTDDQVIVSYTGPIEDGEPIVAEPIGDVPGQGQGSAASAGELGPEREKSNTKGKGQDNRS